MAKKSGPGAKAPDAVVKMIVAIKFRASMIREKPPCELINFVNTAPELLQAFFLASAIKSVKAVNAALMSSIFRSMIVSV